MQKKDRLIALNIEYDARFHDLGLRCRKGSEAYLIGVTNLIERYEKDLNRFKLGKVLKSLDEKRSKLPDPIQPLS